MLVEIDFIVPPLCDRLGVPLPYDTGTPAPPRRRSPTQRSTTVRAELLTDAELIVPVPL
ncbi:hypothetical protein [Methyloceanibacter sp.]|uniref:hypothetical protein n=1 Tax=Methyloceanibacter sp. TaxID=1965321 RepID=UPI003D9BC28E